MRKLSESNRPQTGVTVRYRDFLSKSKERIFKMSHMLNPYSNINNQKDRDSSLSNSGFEKYSSTLDKENEQTLSKFTTNNRFRARHHSYQCNKSLANQRKTHWNTDSLKENVD